MLINQPVSVRQILYVLMVFTAIQLALWIIPEIYLVTVNTLRLLWTSNISSTQVNLCAFQIILSICVLVNRLLLLCRYLLDQEWRNAECCLIMLSLASQTIYNQMFAVWNVGNVLVMVLHCLILVYHFISMIRLRKFTVAPSWTSIHSSFQFSPDDSCSVCLILFELSRKNIVKLICTHMFHQKCIEPWLLKHNTCPVCRANV
jgi:hypothetical protein